ncbi:CAF17-like 4Fe-4S cluster assembly/insertion protein YgfZ [Oceanitalea stevensii]|uniref:Folate-binding protein YgfZ n=1 Tax=Oceanitalea stevensii TaxID=2763072 RepID=A0ABR8Z1E0_9MICO|nr:glycine cleavage T C-terminal barrel domain-containing protein [Oceanitalea stevensii]MBD8061786.1 folate-binding protein YgfZ [Oceanitalea stevensii]
MTSPLLSRPGAVAGGGPDAGVALHYGQPAQEQRALERGLGVVDLSQLGVVTVSGPDRLSWLNTLSTQLLLQLAPGQSGELLLLDPNGRIEHAAAVADDGERAWLVTEGDHVAPLVAFLERMRFMLRVEVTDVTEHTAVVGTCGDGWHAVAAAPGHVLTWHDPWPTTAPGGTSYGPADDEHPGRHLRRSLGLVDRARLADVVDASGLRVAGTWAWEALRVEAWRPRLGREVDERAIPHELDWLRTGVHLDKGCYRGQETVARVFNLGRPPRRLVMLHLDGSEHLTPEPGARVVHGDKDVGVVTSVVRHAELGPVALALVKRSLPADAELVVDGIAAAQEVIVPVSGEAVGRPSERPGQELRRRPRA